MFRRALIGILTIFCIITIVFFALRLIPGDPADVWLGDYATPELIKLTRAKWGLDKPVWVQYLTYLDNIVRADLDNSLRMGAPVADLILRHYPFTLRLVFLGTSLSIIIAIPVGILAAVRQNSRTDMFVMMFSFLFISMPSFWLGLIVLFTFSFRLGWFPAIGGEGVGNLLKDLSFLALPSICLGIRYAGLLSRIVRSTMIDTLGKEFITVARSKGVSERMIRYKHALRNALSPIISLIGVSLVLSLAGAVVLEIVFSRPGLGRLYVSAVAARDYPLVQGCILVIATAVVLVNMLVDISYGMIDPRIRYE
jgi:ABC-type dipeptide/oligopeptide/nickel transport system permease component